MKGWQRAILWTIGILAVIFGVLRYFFIDFHQVPDDPNDVRNWSNAPNLEPGDFVLVWRAGNVHVGDMVRCADPTDGTRWFAGRVIGLPGDKVDITDGTFRINGFRVGTSGCMSRPRKIKDGDGIDVEMPCAMEEIGGSKHEIYVKNLPQFAEAQVEAGKIFILSDNRNAPWAYDSRTPELGAFPEEACKQRLVLRLWSKKGWGDAERRMGFLF